MSEQDESIPVPPKERGAKIANIFRSRAFVVCFKNLIFIVVIFILCYIFYFFYPSLLLLSHLPSPGEGLGVGYSPGEGLGVGLRSGSDIVGGYYKLIFSPSVTERLGASEPLSMP